MSKMILRRKDGARLDKVDELITETKDYPAQWVKPPMGLSSIHAKTGSRDSPARVLAFSSVGLL